MNNDPKVDLSTIYRFFKAARDRYWKGDYKKAMESYQAIINSGHRYVDAFSGIAACQHMLGNQEAAESTAKEALQIKPDHFESLQLLATIYNAQGKNDLAYEYVSLALSNIPHSAADISPRLVKFTKKIAPYVYSGNPDEFVEEQLGLEEEDRIWLAWARDFKAKYEADQLHQNS